MDDPVILSSLGQRLRRHRKARGWSQEKLAEKTALTRTYIGAIERGKRSLSVIVFLRLARTMDLSLDDLCAGLGEEMQPDEQLFSPSLNGLIAHAAISKQVAAKYHKNLRELLLWLLPRWWKSRAETPMYPNEITHLYNEAPMLLIKGTPIPANTIRQGLGTMLCSLSGICLGTVQVKTDKCKGRTTYRLESCIKKRDRASDPSGN